MSSIPAPADLLRFTGQTVIVTGSSGGLGRGLVRRFAEAGANLVLHYHHNAEAAQHQLESLHRAGVRAMAVRADLSHGAEVTALVNAALEAFAGLNVLVNNAGIYPSNALLEITETEWDAVLDSSLRSAFLCTRAFARAAASLEPIHRAVVNITSLEAQVPAFGHAHYGAAKAGLEMLTRSSALELAAAGIRVNAVAPGLIARDGIEAAWPDGVARWRARAPLGRLGTPEDVADACLFLASPAARWITGASLAVDGGMRVAPVF